MISPKWVSYQNLFKPLPTGICPHPDFSTPFHLGFHCLCNEIATNRLWRETSNREWHSIPYHSNMKLCNGSKSKTKKSGTLCLRKPLFFFITSHNHIRKNIQIAVQALLEKQAELLQCRFNWPNPQHIRVYIPMYRWTRIAKRRKRQAGTSCCTLTWSRAHVDMSVDSTDFWHGDQIFCCDGMLALRCNIYQAPNTMFDWKIQR